MCYQNQWHKNISFLLITLIILNPLFIYIQKANASEEIVSKMHHQFILEKNADCKNLDKISLTKEQKKEIKGSFVPLIPALLVVAGVGLSSAGIGLTIGAYYVEDPNLQLLMLVAGSLFTGVGGLVMSPGLAYFGNILSGSGVITNSLDDSINVGTQTADDVIVGAGQALDDVTRVDAISVGKEFLKGAGDSIDESVNGVINSADEATNSVVNSADETANIKWADAKSEKIANEMAKQSQGSGPINHIDKNGEIIKKSVGSGNLDSFNENSSVVLPKEPKSMGINDLPPEGVKTRVLPKENSFPGAGQKLGETPKNPYGLNLDKISTNNVPKQNLNSNVPNPKASEVAPNIHGMGDISQTNPSINGSGVATNNGNGTQTILSPNKVIDQKWLQGAEDLFGPSNNPLFIQSNNWKIDFNPGMLAKDLPFIITGPNLGNFDFDWKKIQNLNPKFDFGFKMPDWRQIRPSGAEFGIKDLPITPEEFINAVNSQGNIVVMPIEISQETLWFSQEDLENLPEWVHENFRDIIEELQGERFGGNEISTVGAYPILVDELHFEHDEVINFYETLLELAENNDDHTMNNDGSVSDEIELRTTDPIESLSTELEESENFDEEFSTSEGSNVETNTSRSLITPIVLIGIVILLLGGIFLISFYNRPVLVPRPYFQTTSNNVDHMGNRPANFAPPGANYGEALMACMLMNGAAPDLAHVAVYGGGEWNEDYSISENYDNRGHWQQGAVHAFVTIDNRIEECRDDAEGHNFGIDEEGNPDPQNRGPHFNDNYGRHFDYN